jgi:hypothetical protein
MATLSVYNKADNRIHSVTINVVYGRLYDGLGEAEYYLDLTTDIRKYDGSSHGRKVIRNLSDVPPGFSTAANFKALISSWIEYFIELSDFDSSSSSTSSSSSSSIESSSSSSSDSSGSSSSSSSS